MLFSFLFNCLLFLHTLFINPPGEKVFFGFFKKTNSNRAPASSAIESDSKQPNFLSFEEKALWKNVFPFNQDKLSLYQWENNQNILISIKKGKGQSIKKISDFQVFFNQMEKRKLITFSKTSVKNRRVFQSKIKKTDNTALLYTSGTYLDFQKEIVFFEDLSFYHDKTSLHILVHNTQQSTPEEIQAIYSFLKDFILSEDSLNNKGKQEFLFLIKQINNENL